MHYFEVEHELWKTISFVPYKSLNLIAIDLCLHNKVGNQSNCRNTQPSPRVSKVFSLLIPFSPRQGRVEHARFTNHPYVKYYITYDTKPGKLNLLLQLNPLPPCNWLIKITN